MITAVQREEANEARKVFLETKKVYPVGKKKISLRRIFAFTLVGILATNNIDVVGDFFEPVPVVVDALINQASGTAKVAPMVLGDQPSWIEQGREVRDQDGLKGVRINDQKMIWNDLPKDPFTIEFLSELNPNHQIDEEKMVGFFLEHRITPAVAMVIVSHIQIAQSTSILGRNDPKLIKSERDRQQASFDFLVKSYAAIKNQNAQELEKIVMGASLENNTMLNLRKLGSSTISGGDDPQKKHLSEGDFVFYDNGADLEVLKEGYLGVVLQLYQSQVVNQNKISQENFPSMKSSAVSRKSLYDAREFLMESVTNAGIASLRIPPEVSYDIPQLYALGTTLNQMNNDLQNFTGWNGHVLGMNYRLIVDLDAALGSAYTYKSDDGYIHMKSWWGSMAHEWLHVNDFTQSEYVKILGVLPYTSSTLSTQNNPKYGEWSDLGDPHQLARASHALWKKIHNPDLNEGQRQGIRNETKTNVINRALDGTGSPVASFLEETEMKAASVVVDEKSPWLHWRKEAIAFNKSQSLWNYLRPSEASYYLDQAPEILAFSFGGAIDAYYHDQQKNSKDSSYRSVVMSSENELQRHFAAYEPSLVEGLATSKSWREYFNATKDWWEFDRQQRKVSRSVSSNFEESLVAAEMISGKDLLKKRKQKPKNDTARGNNRSINNP